MEKSSTYDMEHRGKGKEGMKRKKEYIRKTEIKYQTTHLQTNLATSCQINFLSTLQDKVPKKNGCKARQLNQSHIKKKKKKRNALGNIIVQKLVAPQVPL